MRRYVGKCAVAMAVSAALASQALAPAVALADDVDVAAPAAQAEGVQDAEGAASAAPAMRTPRVTTKVYRYSWHDIKNAVGVGADIATVIGCVATRSSVNAGQLMAKIGAISSLASDLMAGSTDHGIAVQVQISRYYRRGNHIPYRTVTLSTGAWTY